MEFIEPLKGDRIVCVNIGKTYNKRESLYDATRHYWRLNGNRAQLATHVIGVVNGIVKCVFIPEKWYITSNTSPELIGRWEFKGVEDEDSPYLGKSVYNVVNHRSSNPVAYINWD